MEKLSQAKFFLLAELSFIAGLGAASFFPPALRLPVVAFFALALVLSGAGIFAGPGKPRLVFILAACFLFGAWRLAVSQPAQGPDQLAFYSGRTADLSGIVLADPDARESGVRYELGRLCFTADGRPLKGKLLIVSGQYPRYGYGDVLAVSGEIRAPEPLEDFAYDRYLARYGISAVAYRPELKKTESGRGNPLRARIFRLKDAMRAAVDRGLSGAPAGLARAMLLGDKRELDAGLRADFSKTGLSHLAAISGLHVGIISALALNFLLGLGLSRRASFYAVSALLAGFVILVGAPASALRAGLMGFLVLLALHLGRLSRLHYSLVFAALILLLFNPKLLRDDIGFQLSFLAVLGLALVYPDLSAGWQKIQAKRPFLKNRILNGAAEAFLVTLSAQVFTLPVMIANFSLLSVIAPLANILALWTLPWLMTSLLLAALIGAAWPPLAPWLFLPAGLLLNYLAWTARTAAVLPYSHFEFSYLWPGWYFIYLAAVFWLTLKLKKNRQRATARAGFTAADDLRRF